MRRNGRIERRTAGSRKKKNKERKKEASRRAGTEEGRRENEVGQIRKFGY